MPPTVPLVSSLVLDPKQNPVVHLAVVPPWSLRSGTVPQPCFVFHDLHHFEENCRMNLNFGFMLLHDYIEGKVWHENHVLSVTLQEIQNPYTSHPDDVNSEYLCEVVSARLLHCEVTTSFLFLAALRGM